MLSNSSVTVFDMAAHFVEKVDSISPSFVVVSLLALLATRPLAKKYVNSRTQATNADMLIGAYRQAAGTPITNYYPSMAQDVLFHERQTEIGTLNGVISRLPAAIDMPGGRLSVTLRRDGDLISDILLTGPTAVTEEGDLPEALLN